MIDPLQPKQDPGLYAAYAAHVQQFQINLILDSLKVDLFKLNAITPDYHVTVMYAPKLHQLDVKTTYEQVYALAPSLLIVLCDEVTYFTEADKTCALVMKLICPELHELHESLSALGLEHTYVPYQPHLSLAYGLDEDEAAHLSVKYTTVLKKMHFKLAEFYVETLNEHWI